MIRNLNKKIDSSFLSFEKDMELMLKRIFIDSKNYYSENNFNIVGANGEKMSAQEALFRLIALPTPNCLEDNTEAAKEVLKRTNLRVLMKNNYIRLTPKVRLAEHEEVKTYLIFSFDNFVENFNNNQYRDSVVTIDIISNLDYWEIGNYRIRPLKIAGIIDGILNKAKLTGIGEFNFLGLNELILNSELGGYSLMYKAVHGSDDKIAINDEGTNVNVPNTANQLEQRLIYDGE